MLPKIVFKPMSLEDNIDNILWTYNDEEFHDTVCEVFPELKKADNLKNKEEYITGLFTNYYKNNIDEINDYVEKYNLLWNEYNDKYMKALSEYLNTSWDFENITAYVGLVCICPRNLSNHSFEIGVKFADEFVKKICAHETLHFLWFKKWKELYKNCKKSEFESPHIVWKYSEMVVDPIINSKKINNIIHEREEAYVYFYDMMDKNEKVMDILKEICNEDITIEEKIKNGFEYIKEYFKV